MSPYGEIWKFTRERLAQSYSDLTPEQLAWRPNPGAHNIGEWIYHVAGAECWFASRLTGNGGSEFEKKLMGAARASFISDDPFPFGDGDMTVKGIGEALSLSGAFIGPVIESPSADQLSMPVETVIGPVVEGVACLWRVAQHAAYHTGQIWLYRQNPAFPV